MAKGAAEQQLAAFIDKYTPEVAAAARAALAGMRARLPGAVELVFDNYNALAVTFGPDERLADAIFSITLYPRWVSLFFTNGAQLTDSNRLLQGEGSKVRHIVLEPIELLDSARVRALMKQAIANAPLPFDASQPNRVFIKSVSAKQRPRRPG